MRHDIFVISINFLMTRVFIRIYPSIKDNFSCCNILNNITHLLNLLGLGGSWLFAIQFQEASKIY